LGVGEKRVDREFVTMIDKGLKYNLPGGWIEVSLGDIITLEYGKSLTGLEREKGVYKVWGSNGVVGTHNDFLIDGPAIIVGRKGSVGTVHFASDKCWPIDTTYYVSSINSLSPRFIYYLLIHANLSNLDKSTTIPGLNRESAYSQRILLPPLNEQYRIVEKIEELFSEIEDVEINLIDIKKRLTIYWRGMLKTIYEKDNKTLIPLGQISNITMGQSPHGSTYNDKGVGVPLINGPVEFGKTSFSKTILSKWTTKPTKTCKEGDIIICVRGSTTGRLNIAGFDACIGRGVAAIEAKENTINEYILYFLHYKEKSILEMGTGTTFPSISKELLHDLLIPLYSKEEQLEIVNILDNKYTILDNIREIIDGNITQIHNLKQSILCKAFTGKLIPQNSNDESALELLVEIQKERLEFLQNKPTARKVKNKIINMERTKSVLEILEESQKAMSAKDIWQESKHWENIDDFYAELKRIVEDGKIEELPRQGKESFLKLAEK
jgi:type I restriction enzyme S subunit